MAIYRWRGDGAGTKTSWEDGRNWVNESGTPYSEAAGPGNSDTDDDVYFDVAITGTAQAVAGVDTSGDYTLNSVNIMSAYDQDIASSGTYLALDCVTLIIDAAAAGDIYIEGKNLTNVIVRNLKSGSTLYLKGVVQNLYAIKGTVECSVGTWTSTCEVVLGYSTSTTSDLTFTLAAAAATPGTAIKMYGGTATFNKTMSLIQSAGTSTIAAGATTVQLFGGTCEWDATAITTLEAWGGTFTSDLVNAATITNLKIGAGATVNLANPVTTYTNLTNLGGTLSLPLEP